MTKLFFSVMLFMTVGLIYGQKQNETLSQILQRLDTIKTATYLSKSSRSAPGDTTVFHTTEKFVSMFINPKDTILGAAFTRSSIDDHNQYEYCYDGNYGVEFDWENRVVKIDTFTSRYGRPIAPFFVKIKSLIQYTQDNIDSAEVKYTEYKDSIQIDISFKDKIVEFISLQPFVKQFDGKKSRYVIVVDKNFLPYKFVRKMPHQTSWETCKDINISKHIDFEFSSMQQISADFKIKGREFRKDKTYDLENTKAPSWKLKEIHGDSISLDEIKQKIVLIQFTGIGCGPCHKSIPFLKKLADEYKDKNFELVSVETWSDNVSGIGRYKDRNELNYRFLVSNKKTSEQYKIQGVPVFFILDEDRVIKKVVIGYTTEKTDKEITRIIEELLL
ncbi:TlpA disulfide reductase family protein [Mangrovivirga sp. M17]|uniref:TlpA disulfide reductase family protein n=1 Tax=Mangrovivirga halotolerans TaxID=2993936 RepID=A0ABT3RUH7_9BACT|nr:TlpA disulfide reductase family protein [Mangrovivirga halotolerans]MCX2745306.1 TlpA disulfide reductase family protein [Mangrovivirga halotolerans]